MAEELHNLFQSKKRIPAPVIGLLSKIFSEYYTHADLDSIFLTAGAPENIPEASKPKKVTEWLRCVNQECSDPIEVLGCILEDFMDSEAESRSAYIFQKESPQTFDANKDRVNKALSKDGLQYVRGGYICSGQGTSTKTLIEKIQHDGLPAVDIEVKRALDNVEKDPPSAVLAAGAVLEAVFKTYLERNDVDFYEKDTFSSLWKKCSGHIGLNVKGGEDEDLQRVVSGLHDIADGIMHLRNRKSSSHGKSVKQMKYAIAPRHARLSVHAAHTLAAYILDVIDR